ncbi:MAG: DUF3604 domain-containing protein [Blastocatellia bacterium]
MKRTVILLSAGLLALLVPVGVASLRRNETNVKAEAANTASAPTQKPARNSQRNAYFGDLHVHTGWSPDAYVFSIRTTPDDAYRFAKGESITIFGNKQVSITGAPLDFMAVTDHSEYMGVLPYLDDPNHPLSRLPEAQPFRDPDQRKRLQAFRILTETAAGRGERIAAFITPELRRSVWTQVVANANRHYQPGKFTTFAGYEWSSMPNNQNLHRNVIFRDDHVPEMPFTSAESRKPEELWTWLEQQRQQGREVLAIPHNANLSDGRMYALLDSEGKPLDAAYAVRRNRNEPINEISQIKGQSDTHPEVSPNDEFASFEISTELIGLPDSAGKVPGSYIREALRNGVKLQEAGGFNPFRFGLIGSSDTHDAAAPRESDKYFGHSGVRDTTAQARFANRKPLSNGLGGLAGVWAEENTREAIFDAMKRKETFGTSGPRLQLRFFGGWGYSAGLLNHSDWVKTAYSKGVPMGGDLPAGKGKAPQFVVWALKDPNGANLDRIQIIKGWSQNGQTFEKIYNVALSDKRKVGADGKAPPVGNTVDAKTATYQNSIGDAELKAVWTDPDFDASVHAFYYVRVLEIPTPRWSTYDAVRAGIALPAGTPVSVQQRGWSSPIWYTPDRQTR